jgi:hypothetical protein
MDGALVDDDGGDADDDDDDGSCAPSLTRLVVRA